MQAIKNSAKFYPVFRIIISYFVENQFSRQKERVTIALILLLSPFMCRNDTYFQTLQHSLWLCKQQRVGPQQIQANSNQKWQLAMACRRIITLRYLHRTRKVMYVSIKPAVMLTMFCLCNRSLTILTVLSHLLRLNFTNSE